MTLDETLELIGAVLAGGFLGTAIKSLVDRWNAKDANDSADWRAFTAEQRDTFSVAMEEQRKAHDRAIDTMGKRITSLESKFNAEHETLNVALKHLRHLRAWITAGRKGEIPALPEQLEGRL